MQVIGSHVNTIKFGDCRDIMSDWAAQGVKAQMCVTSPPYFGLRDYGVKPTSWPAVEYTTLGGLVFVQPMDCCLGLEPTPEAFIGHLVLVFRAVREVLADDGTLWLNIGDSYARTGGSDRKPSPTSTVGNTQRSMEAMPSRKQRVPDGLKDKDLIGIPWMLAFALRADGWYLRQDIIWNKPNPMPESVRDRCTKAHEYVFLLSKSERYHYDSEAVMEPVAASTIERLSQPTLRRQEGGARVPGKTNGNMKAVGGTERRNRRSVWTVATRPYKGAHFATFPPALIEPCILAGSRPGDIVLDPFMGSGTTAAAALQHGRQYLGCELNPAYALLQQARVGAAVEAGLDDQCGAMTLFDEASA